MLEAVTVQEALVEAGYMTVGQVEAENGEWGIITQQAWHTAVMRSDMDVDHKRILSSRRPSKILPGMFGVKVEEKVEIPPTPKELRALAFEHKLGTKKELNALSDEQIVDLLAAHAEAENVKLREGGDTPKDSETQEETQESSDAPSTGNNEQQDV